MSDPFIAQITLFAGNFAPRGWAFCEGQILSIAQNTALFSLLGTTYGGNGQTTFALPDLRGRVPMHPGTGPGLTPHTLGEQGGTETVTLTTAQMPTHHHGVVAAVGPIVPGGQKYVESQEAGNSATVPDRTDNVGGNQPHPNLQPYTCLNYIIALQGIFPSRN